MFLLTLSFFGIFSRALLLHLPLMQKIYVYIFKELFFLFVCFHNISTLRISLEGSFNCDFCDNNLVNTIDYSFDAQANHPRLARLVRSRYLIYEIWKSLWQPVHLLEEQTHVHLCEEYGSDSTLSHQWPHRDFRLMHQTHLIWEFLFKHPQSQISQWGIFSPSTLFSVARPFSLVLSL